MPAPLKICPFCLVDAHTDASSCRYCGSHYDRVAAGSAHAADDVQTRRGTYDGAHHIAGEARCLSLDAHSG